MGRRTIRPSAASDAERLINSVTQQGRELSHINPFRGGQTYRVSRFLSTGGRAAGVAAEIGGDEAAVAAGEAAGESALAFGAWPLILLFIAVLIVLRLFEGMIIACFSWMPLGWGDKIAHILKIGFSWLDNFENWVMTFVEDQIKAQLHDMVTLVGWCLGKLGFIIPGQGPAPRAMPGQVATEAEVQKLRAQVAHQQVEINSINYALSNPSNLPGPAASPGPVTNVTDVTKTVIVGVPQNLWDQIHALHQKQAQFQKDLDHVANQVSQAVSLSTEALRQVSTLSQSVHAIRAISVGYSEIQAELSNLSSLFTIYADMVDAELERQDRVQKHMAPLGLLLGPGIPGLKNLRTLEDNMCQCPKLPNLPRLAPELLAMYEFVTHG